jgi:ribose transport system permease protein
VDQLLSLAGPYLGLLIVATLFGYLVWRQRGTVAPFLGPDNVKLMTLHAAIPATVALGMTMIIISGGIDLSVGYVVSLVTVTTMLAYRWAFGQPALVPLASLVAIAAGIGTGALAGFCNGLFITRLKVIPFVATLGMMGVARGVAQLLAKGERVTFSANAPQPAWVDWLPAVEPDPPWLGVGPAVWSVLLLAGIVAIVLRYTVLGRYCYALGSNEATARLCGINVNRTKVILYTLAGLLTGWAGVLQFARSQAGLHDVQAGLELDVIAAVVIGGGSLTGGEGTVTGTLAGALLIAFLESGCSTLGLRVELRFIIIGAIIIGVSAVNMWRQRRLR